MDEFLLYLVQYNFVIKRFVKFSNDLLKIKHV